MRAAEDQERPADGPARQNNGPRPGAGKVDADTLRQRWPEILDAVRGERKVAWMLLRTTTVQSLENGLLTLAFPKEGEARGFASSGHDQILIGALAALLGLNVRVRAVTGGPPPGAGSAGAGRPGSSAHRSSPAPGSDPPSPRGNAGPPTSARQQGSAGPSAPAGPLAASGPASADAGTAPDAVPAHPRESARQAMPVSRGQSAAGPAAERGEPHVPRSLRQAGSSADEEWPDDASEAGGGTAAADGLTGMELIRRQLGGRVIEEIEGS